MIEISPEISGEALRFLLFMLAGILLILAFDLFRILRRLIPHRIGVVAVEDILHRKRHIYIYYALSGK